MSRNFPPCRISLRELALRASERKFRDLFERAQEGIFVCDLLGVLENVNPALLDMLGNESREELLARNLFRDIFASPEAVVLFQETLRRQSFLQGYELVFRRKDGAELVVALSCHAVMDDQGEISGYEGMLRDITRQKRSAEEVARMRNYLNNIIESMPSMLIAVDEESRITQWNTAAYQATGISPVEAIGNTLWDIAPFFNRFSGYLSSIRSQRKTIRLHREQLAGEDDRRYNLTFFPLVANGPSGIAIRLDDITAHVFVPLLDRDVGQSVTGAAEMIQHGEGCVLVIDDDEILCKTARAILESIGYTVLLARDGEEGVELYRANRNRVDLVLLDMIMPVMSGREAYIALKEINPEVRVVISSGFRQDARMDEVMALGANAFLQKPYTLEDLGRVIRETMEGGKKEPVA